MIDLTKLEMRVILKIVKSPEREYNANSLSAFLGVTSMGVLKILKRLEREYVLKSKKIGRMVLYRVNIKDAYARKYVSFVLSREAFFSDAKVRRWIEELKKIQSADMIILYGSVLIKSEPHDIDVLFLTEQSKFSSLKKEVDFMNKMNIKKIHPLYQNFQDIIDNIKKRHPPLLNAIKGIVVHGEEKFIEVYNESRKE